jgi:hypothetical protein
MLRGFGVSRLNQIDRATGEPVRRYEHPYPGTMIHVDTQVTRLFDLEWAAV